MSPVLALHANAIWLEIMHMIGSCGEHPSGKKREVGKNPSQAPGTVQSLGSSLGVILSEVVP
jgi:hypothetical protein